MTKAIFDIAPKAADLYRRVNPNETQMNAVMDLMTAEELGLLDLDRLAETDDLTFAHDVLGILKHIDRPSKTIGGCFLPRCAPAQTDNV